MKCNVPLVVICGVCISQLGLQKQQPGPGWGFAALQQVDVALPLPAVTNVAPDLAPIAQQHPAALQVHRKPRLGERQLHQRVIIVLRSFKEKTNVPCLTEEGILQLNLPNFLTSKGKALQLRHRGILVF